jgi:formylglycine-generating enzyme required for sulfatase activity
MRQCGIRWMAGAVSAGLIVFGYLATVLVSGCSNSTGPDPTGPQPPAGMVLVSAGSFVMGDGVAECGEDKHTVTLTSDFYVGKHEVTNQEYMEALQWAYDHGYVSATASSVRDSLDGSGRELLDLDDLYAGECEIAFDNGIFSLRDAGHGVNSDHPVKEVTWYGAVRYCDWLSLQEDLARAYEHGGDWSCNGGDPCAAEGYRLLTDAEWEYAAQYDDERVYPWGDGAPNHSRANYGSDLGWTTAVGSYPDAPADLGLSDMAGNVWEWCNDWWECDLGTAAQQDPAGPPTGDERVLRGSSWARPDVKELRCAHRGCTFPSSSSPTIGFRVARTVPR